jgi:putative phage-type endonuclease
MRVIVAEQRSPEWYAARLGVPSASQFGKIITPTGKRSTQADGYLNKLVAEILTGKSDQQEPNEAMTRGTELEPEARSYYELIGGQVEEVGFCLHDDGFGCSPDGLVGDTGLLEIKCPLAHTHVEYLRENALPGLYAPQVQGQLLVTGREWCDFLSYHPDMRPLLIRVERDEKFISILHDALREMVEQINECVANLRKN